VDRTIGRCFYSIDPIGRIHRSIDRSNCCCSRQTRLLVSFDLIDQSINQSDPIDWTDPIKQTRSIGQSIRSDRSTDGAATLADPIPPSILVWLIDQSSIIDQSDKFDQPD
jgi:hypothetical protein